MLHCTCCVSEYRNMYRSTTVDGEIFMLKIIRVKKFRGVVVSFDPRNFLAVEGIWTSTRRVSSVWESQVCLLQSSIGLLLQGCGLVRMLIYWSSPSKFYLHVKLLQLVSIVNYFDSKISQSTVYCYMYRCMLKIQDLSLMSASSLSTLNHIQTSKAEELGVHPSNPPISSLHTTTTTTTPATKPPVSSPSHLSVNTTTTRGSSHLFQRGQLHQQQKNAEMTRKKLELHKKTQELLLKQLEQQKVRAHETKGGRTSSCAENIIFQIWRMEAANRSVMVNRSWTRIHPQAKINLEEDKCSFS